MERLALLSNESQPGDQPLETDMMRFMAIIGIIFWIVFALIKKHPVSGFGNRLPDFSADSC